MDTLLAPRSTTSPSATQGSNGNDRPRVVKAGGTLPSPDLVIDGLNAAYANQDFPTLEVVLAIFVDAVRGGNKCLVAFDGVSQWRFDEFQSPLHREAYLHLRHRYGKYFTETNGIKADDLILSVAGAHGCRMITNDTFSQPKYRHRFPWLDKDGEKRFIRVNLAWDILQVGTQTSRHSVATSGLHIRNFLTAPAALSLSPRLIACFLESGPSPTSN
jgi:hypothetical protein